MSTTLSKAISTSSGAVWSVGLVIVAALAFVMVSDGGYVAFRTEVCQQGLSTTHTWCSFDKPSGYQFASPCDCVQSCDMDEVHVCRVNSSGEFRSYEAVLHDAEMVYLDHRREVEDVAAYIAHDMAHEM